MMEPMDTDRSKPEPKPQNNQENLSLLPTKAYKCQVDTETAVYKPFPNSLVRWTAQPVLEWIESLAAATEEGEAQPDRGPICIDGVQLSSPTPPLPRQYQQQQQSSSFTPATVTSAPHQPSKRMYEQRTSHPMPKDWDLSYITTRDSAAWNAVQKLAGIAVQYESIPTATHEDDHAYHQIQSRLEFIFGRILGQYPYEASLEYGEPRLLLDTLYRESIQKMQALLDKVSGTTQDTVMSRNKGNDLVLAPQTPSTAVPKKDFSKYMTSWLRDNWTNPYPDEEGLAEMARDCGSTVTVVSNWLINARTRKWRPAIIKATELHRPSDLLLEDSINIFDGKPVRNLDQYDDAPMDI